MMKTPIALLLVLFSMGTTKSGAQQKNNQQQKDKTMTSGHHTFKPMPLTSREREFAVQLLKKTALQVDSSLADLTHAEITIKPAADKWSIGECVRHIAAAETTLWSVVEASLKQKPNPEKREAIKFNDQELVKAVEDRSQKSKTFAALEPANSSYKTVEEALISFRENRQKLIVFVQGTQEDLRSHVLELPLGTYDVYQFILLISAHSYRHVQQIQEVKAGIDFPKR